MLILVTEQSKRQLQPSRKEAEGRGWRLRSKHCSSICCGKKGFAERTGHLIVIGLTAVDVEKRLKMKGMKQTNKKTNTIPNRMLSTGTWFVCGNRSRKPVHVEVDSALVHLILTQLFQ